MILAVAIIYFVVVIIGVGLYTRRKVKTADDFNRGGGGMNWIMVSFAFVLIPLGSGHSMSLWEQSAGELGGSTLWWALGVGGILIPLFMLWLGPMARRTGMTTMPEITKALFGRGFSWLHTAVTIASLSGICAAELIATGVAIFALSGGAVPLRPWGILIAFAFTVLYVFFGGILQMAIVNLINAAVMIIGSFAAVIGIVVWMTGNFDFGGVSGMEAVRLAYESDGLGFKLSQFGQMGNPVLWLSIIIPVVLLHLAGTGVSQAHNMPFFAAKSDADCRKGVFIATAINAMSAVPWVIIGLIAVVVPSVIAAGGNDLASLSVPLAALQMLPAPLVGLLMVSLLAATLSTAGSLTIGFGQLLSHEIVKGALNPRMNQKTELKVTKICILICACICLVPALLVDVIMPVFLWCFMLSVPIFVVYITGMYITRNKVWTWVTLVAGYAVAFWWTFAPPAVPYPFNEILYPVLIVSVVFGMIIPLILKGKGETPYLKLVKQRELAMKAEKTAAK